MAERRPPEGPGRSVALVRSPSPRTLTDALRVALPRSGPGDCPRQLPLLALPERARPMSAERVDALLPLREDVHREKLLQAKALILCALPYRRIETPSVTRYARLGRDSRLVVTYTSVLAGVPLPYGADRALFAWIQTKAYGDGYVAFDSLTDFFEAFGIGRGGRDYEAFRGRLNRLQSLSISLAVETSSAVQRLSLHPIRRSYTPQSPQEASTLLREEGSPQLLLVRDRTRYGFHLDPDFHAYLRANPVPLPLALMRFFHNRPQAWDFAAFVLYRSYAARSPAPVSFEELEQVLGGSDSYSRRLKARYASILDEIRVVYPDLPARFLPRRQGLLIVPWRAGQTALQ
jgi:hypothetical protein